MIMSTSHAFGSLNPDPNSWENLLLNHAAGILIIGVITTLLIIIVLVRDFRLIVSEPFIAIFSKVIAIPIVEWWSMRPKALVLLAPVFAYFIAPPPKLHRKPIRARMEPVYQ